MIVFSQAALNRATLARQMLLARSDRSPLSAIEHLLGLQSQAPFPPYFGLWSRLATFAPEDLSTLIETRQVVRIALMRSTVHLVSARDAATLRPLIQPALERMLNSAVYGRELRDIDRDAFVAAGRAILEESPHSGPEASDQLRPRWPDISDQALAGGLRTYLPLVQVPPRGLWGRSGPTRLTTLESWSGRPLDPAPSIDDVVLRYLGAFGPASIADIQAWCGLTRLGEVADRLRPRLMVGRNAAGVELFDRPDAPRPDPQTPAPVRLLAEWDNITLSYADRTRVLAEEDRRRLWGTNGQIPGMALVDGTVRGIWKLAQPKVRSDGTATVTVKLFGQTTRTQRDEITDEAGRVLAFASPASAHDVRLVTDPG
jgi:hypothetical protein